MVGRAYVLRGASGRYDLVVEVAGDPVPVLGGYVPREHQGAEFDRRAIQQVRACLRGEREAPPPHGLRGGGLRTVPDDVRDYAYSLVEG